MLKINVHDKHIFQSNNEYKNVYYHFQFDIFSMFAKFCHFLYLESVLPYHWQQIYWFIFPKFYCMMIL